MNDREGLTWPVRRDPDSPTQTLRKFGRTGVRFFFPFVMTWDLARPPPGRTGLRDRWSGFHGLRSFGDMIALVLIDT